MWLVSTASTDYNDEYYEIEEGTNPDTLYTEKAAAEQRAKDLNIQMAKQFQIYELMPEVRIRDIIAEIKDSIASVPYITIDYDAINYDTHFSELPDILIEKILQSQDIELATIMEIQVSG